MKLISNLSIGSLRLILSAAGSSLLNGLVSYWPLNEISGVRYDAVGTNHLTDNNTVGSVVRGPEGTVASFNEAATEYLSKSGIPSSPLSGETRTIGLWVKADDVDNHGVGFELGFGLRVAIYNYVGNSGAYCWSYSFDGTAAYTCANYTSTARGSWVLLIGEVTQPGSLKAWYNGNNSIAADTPVAGYRDMSSDNLYIGYFNGIWADGLQSRAFYYDRALTTQERMDLYNGGHGVSYADLPAGLRTGLVSWWELDEVSGVRYDSHGTNHLTDNNTVGSVINAGGAMDGAAASFVAANTEYLSKAVYTGPSGAMTVSFWEKRDATVAQYPYLFRWGQAGSSSDASIRFGFSLGFSRTYRAFISTGGSYQYVSSNAIAAGTSWHHVLASYDASTRKITIYVDNDAGVMSLALPGARLSTVGDLNAGATPATGNYYTGQIDEVAIWDRVLTADERAELFALGSGKYYDFS